MDSLLFFLFAPIIISLIFLDLFVFNRLLKTSINILCVSFFYIIIAIIFGLVIYNQDKQLGLEFFAGYLTEKVLSIDNLFVIKAIFDYFQIAKGEEHKILFIGILTAIILRGLMIMLCGSLLTQFHWLLNVFAVFLIITALKLAWAKRNKSNAPHNSKFIKFEFFKKFTCFPYHSFINLKLGGRFNSFFMALVTVEIMDLIFALDSIPAIFAITQNTMVIYTSNIFAILGLRSLYSLIILAGDKFYYINHAMILILFFIGVKILLSNYLVVTPFTSLAIIALIIITSCLLSLFKYPKKY